jgi:hypothetical protein
MYTAAVIRTVPLAIAKGMIAANMGESNEWLMRGLMAIYNHQTHEEQQRETTKDENGIGFNGVDAPILSSIAKQWQARKWVSNKQLVLLRQRLRKYSGQLARIAQAGRAAGVAEGAVREELLETASA